MNGLHHYTLTVKWTGNKGTGTSNYRDYERSHSVLVDNKTEILGSSDPAFLGDKTKHNPEDLSLLQFLPVICFGICICVRKRE